MVRELDAFLLAALAGLIVAAPPGPLGALCARTSVRRGRRAGMAIGFAIAGGEAVHAVLATWGGFRIDALPRSLRLVAGLVLALLLAVLAWRAWSSAGRPPRVETRSARTSALGVFLLALATPGTLPAYVLIFAALGLPGGAPGPVVAGGAVAGALAWWSFVCSAAHRMRHRIGGSPALLERACGALFLLGACGALRAALA